MQCAKEWRHTQGWRHAQNESIERVRKASWKYPNLKHKKSSGSHQIKGGKAEANIISKERKLRARLGSIGVMVSLVTPVYISTLRKNLLQRREWPTRRKTTSTCVAQV